MELGSRNGTAIDGHALAGAAPVGPDVVIRAGLSRFRVACAVDDRPVAIARGLGARGGTIPFNRPPRRAPVVEQPSIAGPGPAPAAPRAEPLSMAGIVLPILGGAVVAVMFSPFFAVFAALGPVLTIGTWWERRRRARREYRLACAAFDDSTAAFRALLPAARRAEIARRRGLHPDPAEVGRRATTPSAALWERRRGDPDAFRVAIGVVDDPFDPPIEVIQGDEPADEALAILAAVPVMPDVPLGIDLSPGRVMGIVGDRSASVALARSLVLQLVTHHGPADLALIVAADRPSEWEWATWLPHTADPASGRRGVGLVATHDPAPPVGWATDGGRATFALLDGDDPFQGRGTAGRRLVALDTTSAVVLVRDEHRLPARCDTVVRVDAFGRIVVIDPRTADGGRAGLGWGVDLEPAMLAARRLARLDDPELPIVGAGVPRVAPLLGLLGLGGDDPAEVEQRWRRTDGTASLTVPIGTDGEGPVVLDFVADGPHVLVGGTTGSGKSELLRSMVAGVAASADPDHVAIVLVDYKGGAAFDCCADLPHVAGLVTDLDDDLAARAMRCLEAELRYRERRLRAVGADDMASFRATAAGRGDISPLPRLLVVVDEFASLVADLPEFVAALVGIAQRGRSLGVHMVLATQRPAGVVTDDIRANTGCRIALRVTDRTDSIDVIGAPDAASIPRDRLGRAVARFGPGELVPFQAAHVSGCSDGRAGVWVRDDTVPVAAAEGRPTDLERLVAAVRAAHIARGTAPPRSPWPPALPVDIRQPSIASGDWFLVDDPDEQRRYADRWSLDHGHLVVVGAPGSGTSTTLAAAAMAAVRSEDEPRPHIHVIDLDVGDLVALGGLAAAGTVTGPADTTRRVRLLRWLDQELSRRRGHGTPTDPPLLLVVDDFGGLARAHDVVREPAVHEAFARIWSDGPAVGITAAVSLRRAAELPMALMATAGTVLLHQTADQGDAARFGLRVATDRFPPGRAVRAGDGSILQVVRESGTLADAVARLPTAPLTPAPHEVGELHARIVASAVGAGVDVSARGAELRIAVADLDLGLASLRLHRAEHALVLGPARSGRTTALAAIARAAGRRAVVVGDDLGRRSGLAPVDPATLPSLLDGCGPTLVLVDDALDVADDTGDLARLVARPPPGVHIVAAARPDAYRSAYGHWTTEIRRSRAGLLLRPEPLDGDLLGLQLPARLDLPRIPGRGVVVVDGVAEVVQVVVPDDQSAS